MFIILDYDETYTEAPVLWDQFITMAKEHGHTIVCCTLRLDDGHNDDVMTDMAQHDIEIVYAAKLPNPLLLSPSPSKVALLNIKPKNKKFMPLTWMA